MRMSSRVPGLYFAVPGFLACLMVLGSATVIIAADSLRNPILYGCLLIAGIASGCWILGVAKTTKNKGWDFLSVVVALISAFALIVIGAITTFWIKALDLLTTK